MSKFTPGPWKIIPGFCKMKVYAGEKYQGHFCIADCRQFEIANDQGEATIEKEANAALIAAAPAMYEALQNALEALELEQCDEYGKPVWHQDEIKQIKAALRAADGGE